MLYLYTWLELYSDSFNNFGLDSDVASRLANRWVNYWAWGDFISGPLPFQDVENVAVDIDEDYFGEFEENDTPSMRTLGNTFYWHAYTGMTREGHDKPLVQASVDWFRPRIAELIKGEAFLDQPKDYEP